MASRSYLFACNNIPGTSDTPEKSLIGLSESTYDIPLAYKILLSPDPSACRSRIWSSEQDLAIIGDFDAGLAELTLFLEKITLTQVQPAIEDTLKFLHNPNNRSQYLLLECAEIFDLYGPDLGTQNLQLVEDMSSLHDEQAHALNTINVQSTQVKKRRFGIFPRRSQRSATPETALRAAAELGLYAWSNELQFDFS